MRAILFLTFFVAQLSCASNCLRAESNELVVLTGTVEYLVGEGSPRSFAVILHLDKPVCVEGTNLDGVPFKKNGLTSLKIANFMDFKEPFPTHKRVKLRGQLWRAMFYEEKELVAFAVVEVLQVPDLSANTDASPVYLIR